MVQTVQLSEGESVSLGGGRSLTRLRDLGSEDVDDRHDTVFATVTVCAAGEERDVPLSRELASAPRFCEVLGVEIALEDVNPYVKPGSASFIVRLAALRVTSARA